MAYRRPHFVREESWRYKRVKESWRSPRGKTSRVRRSKKGWPPVVKIGYSRPKTYRGGHPSGMQEIMVWRAKDLQGIDPKIQAARIAHSVGERKRVDIIDQAKKANIRILNPGPKKEPAIAPEVTTQPSEPTEPAPAEEPTTGSTNEPKLEPSPETLAEEPLTAKEPTHETMPEPPAEALAEGAVTANEEPETAKEPAKKRKAAKKTKKRSKK